MPITQKQKDIAARVKQHIKNKKLWPKMLREIRENIEKENEYMDKHCKHHTPTPAQRQAEYNSPE
jgi:hypothetical protein